MVAPAAFQAIYLGFQRAPMQLPGDQFPYALFDGFSRNTSVQILHFQDLRRQYVYNSSAKSMLFTRNVAISESIDPELFPQKFVNPEP